VLRTLAAAAARYRRVETPAAFTKWPPDCTLPKDEEIESKILYNLRISSRTVQTCSKVIKTE
jgi:hypothetical protein